MTAGLFWGLGFRTRTQAARLHQDQKRFFVQEVQPLSSALADFSAGNLTTRIEKPVAAGVFTGVSGFLSPLKDEFHRIHATIGECLDEFNAITYEPCRRICYVGTDNFLEGERCGELLGGLLQGKGEVAILLNSFDKVNHRLRQKGFTTFLSKKYPGIRVVEVLETYQIPEKTYEKTLELLDRWPRLAGLYVDEASTPHMAIKALKERRKIPGIQVVAHDVTELSVGFIREGILTTLSQNPYSQGFEPIVQVYNYLVTQQKLLIDRILPKSEELETINATSLGQFWDDKQGRCLSERAQRTLAVPAPNTQGNNYRISVLLPNDTGFFKQVGQGMKEAAQLLKPLGVTVNILVPEEIKRGDNSAATTAGYLRREVSAGAQALVTPIFDKSLVQTINELTAQGVVVATFNSEPIGLRAMIDSVFHNSNYILEASETLAANSLESMQSTRQINDTMQKIVFSLSAQLDQLAQTETVIQELLESVGLATTRSGESVVTADEASAFAVIGQQRVSQTNAALSDIQAHYQNTAALLGTLNKNSQAVQEIVTLMEDLASQTNLIAINISILAARAGKNGSEFSVVATDIRKLAQRSAVGAVDIAKLIDQTLGSLQSVTSIIEDDSKALDSIGANAGQAEASLQDIIRVSADNKTKVHHIIELVDKMRSLSIQVRTSMSDLSQLNHVNTEAIEEITRSSLQMARQVQDNTRVSQVLCDMARSQKDLLSQYFN